MPGITKNTHYLQLLKSLYGLKQAPRAWFEMVKKEFGKLGLQASNSDPNLFIGRGVYILLFVDDMLIIGNRKQVDSIKHEIHRLWNCQDLKAASIYVGFQIERDRQNRTLRIHQTAYTTRLLEKLGMANSNPRDLPVPAGTVLRSTAQDLDKYEELDEDQAAIYRTIVGATIYLSNITRPDIAYATGQLARMMAKPNTNHLSMAKGLLRYLKGTATTGITYQPMEQREDYKIWSDATWGTEDDRKSFQGYVLIRHGGAISWTACHQKSTTQSTMEAEICVGSEGACQAAWFEKLVKDLNEKTNILILIIDNAVAEELLKTWKSHSKAKYIEIREIFIRDDMVLRNRLVVHYTLSMENIADALTK
jgi:histone deacetylase 1/2